MSYYSRDYSLYPSVGGWGTYQPVALSRTQPWNYTRPYSRILSIDTRDIDLSRPPKSTYSIGDESVGGRIHRGRSVVRLRTQTRESPGARLVQKFTIRTPTQEPEEFQPSAARKLRDVEDQPGRSRFLAEDVHTRPRYRPDYNEETLPEEVLKSRRLLGDYKADNYIPVRNRHREETPPNGESHQGRNINLNEDARSVRYSPKSTNTYWDRRSETPGRVCEDVKNSVRLPEEIASLENGPQAGQSESPKFSEDESSSRNTKDSSVEGVLVSTEEILPLNKAANKFVEEENIPSVSEERWDSQETSKKSGIGINCEPPGADGGGFFDTEEDKPVFANIRRKKREGDLTTQVTLPKPPEVVAEEVVTLTIRRNKKISSHVTKKKDVSPEVSKVTLNEDIKPLKIVPGISKVPRLKNSTARKKPETSQTNSDTLPSGKNGLVKPPSLNKEKSLKDNPDDSGNKLQEGTHSVNKEKSNLLIDTENISQEGNQAEDNSRTGAQSTLTETVNTRDIKVEVTMERMERNNNGLPSAPGSESPNKRTIGLKKPAVVAGKNGFGLGTPILTPPKATPPSATKVEVISKTLKSDIKPTLPKTGGGSGRKSVGEKVIPVLLKNGNGVQVPGNATPGRKSDNDDLKVNQIKRQGEELKVKHQSKKGASPTLGLVEINGKAADNSIQTVGRGLTTSQETIKAVEDDKIADQMAKRYDGNREKPGENQPASGLKKLVWKKPSTDKSAPMMDSTKILERDSVKKLSLNAETNDDTKFQKTSPTIGNKAELLVDGAKSTKKLNTPPVEVPKKVTNGLTDTKTSVQGTSVKAISGESNFGAVENSCLGGVNEPSGPDVDRKSTKGSGLKKLITVRKRVNEENGMMKLKTGDDNQFGNDPKSHIVPPKNISTPGKYDVENSSGLGEHKEIKAEESSKKGIQSRKAIYGKATKAKTSKTNGSRDNTNAGKGIKKLLTPKSPIIGDNNILPAEDGLQSKESKKTILLNDRIDLATSTEQVEHKPQRSDLASKLESAGAKESNGTVERVTTIDCGNRITTICQSGIKVKIAEPEPAALVEAEEVATRGAIKRHNSKRRPSANYPDDTPERKASEDLLAEEAAFLDTMIQERMLGQRRKSSLGLPKTMEELQVGTGGGGSVKKALFEPIREAGREINNNVPAEIEDSAMTYYDRRQAWKMGIATAQDEQSSSSEESSEESSTEEEDDCDVNCHRKCEKLMPNLCGINQKLIVEALAKLKKGIPRSKTFYDTPLTESSEYETSSGEGSSSCEGLEATAPATTIPRFRKYTIDDFQFLKVLGKGSFGKVLLAELKGSEYYYAVKCLKKDVVLEDDDVECTMIERKVLALGTGHPYLCHLFCTFQTESHLFFVMEYLNGGDLMFHIQKSGRFDEGRARFYAAEIVSGLKFLHKKGIVYRDLKLDNILLDFDGHVRIADFGMCKLQIYLDKTADTFCGTPDYMAPEVIKGQKYNQCVDWWSFGILLYEMLVGQSPFSGCDEDELFWCICNKRPHIPRYLSNQGKAILLSLLEKDWTKRLGSSENGAVDVMNHEFFEGLAWHSLERRALDPPFKPSMSHPLDTKYFDRAFTSERPRLTTVDKEILQSMDQAQFQGFSYTNPNATE